MVVVVVRSLSVSLLVSKSKKKKKKTYVGLETRRLSSPCLAPAAATATAVFLCGLTHRGGLGDVEVVAAGTGWLSDASR